MHLQRIIRVPESLSFEADMYFSDYLHKTEEWQKSLSELASMTLDLSSHVVNGESTDDSIQELCDIIKSKKQQCELMKTIMIGAHDHVLKFVTENIPGINPTRQFTISPTTAEENDWQVIQYV